MTTKLILMAAATLAIATTVAAQPAGRALLDPKKFWTAGGSEQSSKTIRDSAVPGGKAIQMTSTGENSKYSANVSNRLVGAYKRGERLSLSGYVRADQPTRITLTVDLVDAPYSRVGGGEIDVTTEWKPYQVEFTSPADYSAGVTRAIVQLNSEARTVYFGPLTVTASGE